ncbi:hypothetical protein C1645_789208, partial [Glomus cerebriforme]
ILFLCILNLLTSPSLIFIPILSSILSSLPDLYVHFHHFISKFFRFECLFAVPFPDIFYYYFIVLIFY